MVELTRDRMPTDPADPSDPTLRPQTSEDDYSGKDGGTSNAEAVATSQRDASRNGDDPASERQPVPPEDTRSPTPPQPER